MKASELRLGNYVSYAETGTQFRVAEIALGGLEVHSDEEMNWIEIEEFEGIPLTEEWLLKFGAVNADEIDKFGGFLLPPGIRILKDENGFYHLTCQPFGREIRLPFVHKLQNFIYEYTGTELTI